MGWLTTTLIVLPLGVGFLLCVLPFPKLAAAIVGGAAAVLEIVFWAIVLGKYDFSGGGLQFQNHQVWSSDLGASYHTAMTRWGMWLVGMTVIVMAAAIFYAIRAGRERLRLYLGLLLVLSGAVVGVFASQDFLLFYVFWELMLIPLYVLVGVWGGANRLRATITFFIYTIVGSLLMLASTIAFGITHGSFDFYDASGNLVVDNSSWMFLGFVAAFIVKGPLFPFHAWLPLTYREAPAELAGVLSGVVSKAATFGFFTICVLHFQSTFLDFRTPLLVLASIGLIYGSILAFRAPDIRGVIAYSSLAQVGLITLGIFSNNFTGWNGAWLQMVNHGLISGTLFMFAGLVERRTGTGQLDQLGGMARGRPILASLLMATGVIALAVPGSTAFAGEFLILAGVFTSGWAWAVIGAFAIVLAAMYVLRLVSAILHRHKGAAVPDDRRDLHVVEIAVLWMGSGILPPPGVPLISLNPK